MADGSIAGSNVVVGKPCRNCGESLRYVADRRCVACRRERARKEYHDNRAAKCAYNRRYYGANKRREPVLDQQRGLQQRLSAYKWSAKNRGLGFELTRQQAFDLFSGKCSICGRQDLVTYKSIAVQAYMCGIDRIDSQQGYTIDNSRSCCKRHNMSKQSSSEDEYVNLSLETVLYAARNRADVLERISNALQKEQFERQNAPQLFDEPQEDVPAMTLYEELPTEEPDAA